eukprot:4479196-Pleurochrysis_carterae.AAC.1
MLGARQLTYVRHQNSRNWFQICEASKHEVGAVTTTVPEVSKNSAQRKCGGKDYTNYNAGTPGERLVWGCIKGTPPSNETTACSLRIAGLDRLACALSRCSHIYSGC